MEVQPRHWYQAPKFEGTKESASTILDLLLPYADARPISLLHMVHGRQTKLMVTTEREYLADRRAPTILEEVIILLAKSGICQCTSAGYELVPHAVEPVYMCILEDILESEAWKTLKRLERFLPECELNHHTEKFLYALVMWNPSLKWQYQMDLVTDLVAIDEKGEVADFYEEGER